MFVKSLFNGNLEMAGFNNMRMIDGIFESWRKFEMTNLIIVFLDCDFFNSICLFNNRNSIWFDRLMEI